MRIQVRTSKLDIDSKLEAYLERRLRFSLGRFDDVVRQIEVTLSDINGPKGGDDKLCRMRVDLKRQSRPVFAEILHEDLRTSIDLAADRIGRAVSRAVNRQSGLRISRRRAAAVSSRAGQLTSYFG